MRLMGYLGMFRKSQKVSARNFASKGVKTSHKHNPGTPPAYDRVKIHKMLFPNKCLKKFKPIIVFLVCFSLFIGNSK